jgi:hypothetical protein
LADYTFIRDSGVLRRLVDSGRLVASDEVDPAVLGEQARGAPIVVEHPRIPFVSYPYEWPFSALEAAALFHLDLQIDLLADGVMMSDASANNVQFIGREHQKPWGSSGSEWPRAVAAPSWCRDPAR